MNNRDREMLVRCVELATEALDAGNEPFGSVLVDASGAILHEARNEVSGGDQTQHPEFTLARWAAEHLDPDQRAAATVYTSGEHCPMCSAAHAWVGLGRIVYAASSKQFVAWRAELGVDPSAVRPLPIGDIAPGIPVDGPDEHLAARVRTLVFRAAGRADA